MPKITKHGGPTMEPEAVMFPGAVEDQEVTEESPDQEVTEPEEFAEAPEPETHEEAPEVTNESVEPHRPPINAPKADWVEYVAAVSGDDPSNIDTNNTKAELIERYG